MAKDKDGKNESPKHDPVIRSAMRMGQFVREGKTRNLAREVDKAKARGFTKDKKK